MTEMGIAPKTVPPREFRTRFRREAVPADLTAYNPKYKSVPTKVVAPAAPAKKEFMPIPKFKETPKNTPGAEIKPAHKKLPELPMSQNPLAVKTTTYNPQQGIRIGVERMAPARPATSGLAPRTRLNSGGSDNPVFKNKTYIKDKKAFDRKTRAEAAASSTPTKKSAKKGSSESASKKKSKRKDSSEHHYSSIGGETTYVPISRRLGETPSGSYTGLKKIPHIEMKPLKKKSLLDKAIDKLPAAMKKPYKKKSFKKKYSVPPVPKKSFDPDVSAAGKKKYPKYQNQGFIKDSTINEGKSMLGAKQKQGSNLELSRMDMEVPFRGRLRRNQSQESLVARTGLSQPLRTSKHHQRIYSAKQAWRSETGKRRREYAKKGAAGAALVGILGGTIGGAAGVGKYLARNKWDKEEWFPHEEESIKAENEVNILNEIPTPTPKVPN